MSLDMTYFNEMEAKIPHGKVRTRFAPSVQCNGRLGHLGNGERRENINNRMH